MQGDADYLSAKMRDLSYEKFDIDEIDMYGLPNLLKLLKTSRYALIDEIMQSKLLTIKEVLRKEV